MIKNIPQDLWAKCLSVFPRACVDVIVYNQIAGVQSILLLRRIIPPDGGNWAFPGGSLRKGETMKEAATRLVDNETGIDISPDFLPLVAVVPYFFQQRHDVAITYCCHVENKDVKLSNQHDTYCWVTLDNLPSPLHSATLEQIHAFMRLS